jgi:hypothetical protein
MAHPTIVIKQVVKKTKKTVSSISLFVVLILLVTWLFISGEAIFSSRYFDRSILIVHMMGLLLFMTLYRYWARHGKTKAETKLRDEKLKGIMSVPLFQAIPFALLGGVLGGAIGWLLFNQLYGVQAVSFSWVDLIYIGIYYLIIVSTVETIMFQKIMYDMAAGTEDKAIARDEKFSRRGAVISAVSFGTFHLGVIQIWNINALAWVIFWGYIFARLSRKPYFWFRGKRRKVPILGLSFVWGLHGFLDIFMVIYPLTMIGVG